MEIEEENLDSRVFYAGKCNSEAVFLVFFIANGWQVLLTVKTLHEKYS